MATDTAIEWADKSWSPIIGCDRVSPACDRCYAMNVARIREFNPNPRIRDAFAGTTVNDGNGVDWSGKVNLLADRLGEPLRWKKPAKIFVNSMSDLFHKDVPKDFIVKVFAIMALTPQHTYQILTKRHARMRSVLRDECTCGAGHVPGVEFRSAMAWAVSKANPDRIPGLPNDAERRVYFDTPWPLPNVHLGVSVENQQWADIRIPALLDTPAAVRWISAEPLLGPVDLWGKVDRYGGRPKLTYWLDGRPHWGDEHVERGQTYSRMVTGPRLDWVVGGGETGAKSRPSHPDWFRTLRDQCATSGIPFFFKQWGDWAPSGALVIRSRPERGSVLVGEPVDDMGHRIELRRVGKKTAGRLLDGVEHNAFPEVSR